MKSRLLPNRIDSVTYQYGELTEASDSYRTNVSYTIEAMASTIYRAAANQGVLGAHCNVLMLCKAIYGRHQTSYQPPTRQSLMARSKQGWT